MKLRIMSEKEEIKNKKRQILIFLILMMISGFYLRSYHMDFPVIGYHNMKENQYIPYTEFMYYAEEWQDYFRTETYLAGTQVHGYFTQYELPLISWMILPLWWLFGIKLWAARLVVILLTIGSIPLLYIVTKKITENECIALAASFLFTIMPISIFFGRNVQPEAPGLFFILFGTYFFLCWREKILQGTKEWKYFLLFSGSILIAILLKIPNGIGIVPLLFFVPYQQLKKEKKQAIQYVLVFICIMALFPIWVKISQVLMPNAGTVGTASFTESFREVRDNLIRTLTQEYWQQHFPGIKSFVVDNFTLWFFWLTVIGICLGAIKYKTMLGKFLCAEAVALIMYIFIFADKFRGHAYYQFVFLPLVCIASAYVVYVVAELVQKIAEAVIKKNVEERFRKILFYGIFILVIIGTQDARVDATARVFDTIYYGEDSAGEFINKNSAPEDRIFVDGVFAQSSGILWHAHRYGTDEIPANLSYVQELEQTLNFRWVVLYGPGIGTIQSKGEVWEYIQQNYVIRQVGLIPQENQFIPYYVVLEKGGVFDLEMFAANKTPYLAKTYTNTEGTVEMYAIDEQH